jgi:predicted RNA-binding protein with TRAM domain
MERERRREMRGFAPKPVKVGDELDVDIEAVGAKGDGIAKVSGFVIFVPNGKMGEKLHVKITRVGRRSAVGEIIQ